MKLHTNQKRVKLFTLSIIFLILLVCFFLLFGDAVNNYYQIHVPQDDNIIELHSGFSQKSINPDSIKILIWNVYKGQKDGWAHDFDRLSTSMDIILIQEACLKNRFKDVFCVDDIGWHFAKSFLYRTKDLSTTGVMTLSKASPFSTNYLLTQFCEPFTRTPKISLLNEYPIKQANNKLLVINTHGINFVGMTAFKSQILKLEKKIKIHQGPIIFAGDFNT